MTDALRCWVHGAGGHAKVVADVVRSAGGVVLGFVEDARERWGQQHAGLPIVSFEEAVASGARHFVSGVGGHLGRAQGLERARAAGFELPVVVHARAVVAPSAALGAGTVVMAGAVINPDARVGLGVIVNTGAVVEHDNRVGDYVLLGPNVSLGGTVAVGARTLVGVGATVLPNLHVGADVRVGGGAVVTRDVADGLTVVGVPARTVGSGA